MNGHVRRRRKGYPCHRLTGRLIVSGIDGSYQVYHGPGDRTDVASWLDGLLAPDGSSLDGHAVRIVVEVIE